jgi:hypothetical protein
MLFVVQTLVSVVNPSTSACRVLQNSRNSRPGCCLTWFFRAGTHPGRSPRSRAGEVANEMSCTRLAPGSDDHAGLVNAIAAVLPGAA